MDAAAGDPARLVLDLVANRSAEFPARDCDSRIGCWRHSRRRPQPPPAKNADPRPLVVLDPGHGGIDTGTIAPGGEMEKDIVLDFAKRLRERIEKSGKYRVLMTRNDDTFVPLDERVRIARNAGASLFVSIHADSLPRKEGDCTGRNHLYAVEYGLRRRRPRELADKENGADVIAGVDLKAEPDDVAGILIDLAQRETKSFSMQFAHDVVGDMKAVTRLHKAPIKVGGVPRACGRRTCPRSWSNSVTSPIARTCSR